MDYNNTSRASVAVLLRVARATTGQTQGEVARKAGVLPVRISDFEHGRRRPRPDELARIWQALAPVPSK